MLTLCDNPKTEIIRSLSFADYCRLPGLNQSLLKTYAEEYEGCPALYFDRSKNPSERSSDSLDFGRAFHSRLLEPAAFESGYRVMTAGDCETIFQQMLLDGAESKSKAEYMKHQTFASMQAAECRGFSSSKAFKAWAASDPREILDQEDAGKLSNMTAAMWANPQVAREMDGVTLNDCEVSILFPLKLKDGRQFQAKTRNDLICATDAIIDAKTCRSTNKRRFAADVARYGYDIQSAFYLMGARAAGLDKKRFGFLAQEKTAPFLNRIHWMPDDWVKWARLRVNRIGTDIADSIESGIWPNPESGPLEPPSWMAEEIELVA